MFDMSISINDLAGGLVNYPAHNTGRTDNIHARSRENSYSLSF